jgi:hypothetical protein
MWYLVKHSNNFNFNLLSKVRPSRSSKIYGLQFYGNEPLTLQMCTDFQILIPYVSVTGVTEWKTTAN